MFLEHVNLTVADLDRSIELDSELLDLRVRWRGETTGGSPAAHVGDGRCHLALFEATEPSTPAVDYGRVGFNLTSASSSTTWRPCGRASRRGASSPTWRRTTSRGSGSTSTTRTGSSWRSSSTATSSRSR